MLRIALAEDNPRDEALIRQFCDVFFEKRGQRAELLTYEDGQDLVDAAPSHVDLYLLDIEMPRLDGLALARRIRESDTSVTLCFLTSLGHLAPEGYSVDAAGFMIKPLSYESFCKTMARLLDRIEHQCSLLAPFREGKSERFENLRSITHFEASGKRTIVHTTSGVFSCAESLRSIEARLADTSLFRIHNAFLVNMDFIETVTATDVFVEGQALPLSKHRKAAFMQALATYVGRRLA